MRRVTLVTLTAFAALTCIRLAWGQAPAPEASRSRVCSLDVQPGRWVWLKQTGESTELLTSAGGGTPQVIARGTGWTDVALDGNTAWLLQREGDGGAVLRCPLAAGSSPSVVAGGLESPSGLKAFEGGVFWVETSPLPRNGHPGVPLLGPTARFRVRDSSGQVRTVADWPVTPGPETRSLGSAGPRILAADRGALFASVRRPTTTEFIRVPLSGGSATRLVIESGDQSGTLRDGLFYWTGPSEEAGAGTQLTCVRRFRSDGSAETICDWLDAGGTLVACRRGLLYAHDRLFRVPNDGGVAELISGTLSLRDRVATDGSAVVGIGPHEKPLLVTAGGG
jgi:hypothetical protein